MSLFKTLFKGKRKPPFDFMSLGFPKLDISYVLNDLDVEAKAKDSGSHQLPLTKDTELDGPQQRIIQYVTGDIAEITAECGTSLLGYNRRIARIDVKQNIGEIQSLKGNFAQALGDLKKRGPLLKSLKEGIERVGKELRRFKEKNNLKRDAQYPDSYFLYIAILVGIGLIEGLVNAFYFRAASDMGYTGGVVQAGLFALVDIVICCYLGRRISLINSIDVRKRVLGFLIVLFLFLWVIGYNLMVAHYRDQLSVVPDKATVMALSSFRSNPFGLIDLNSWLLFLMGAVFSIVAMGDGYKWDDPYPGYGKLRRRYKEEYEEYDFQKRAIVEEASKLRDDSLKRLNILSQGAISDINALENAINTKETMLKNIQAFVDNYEVSCRAILQTYRDENQKHRRTPVPTYFQESWRYDVPKEFKRNTADRRKLSDQKIEISKLPEIKEENVLEIKTLFDNFLVEGEQAID